MRELQTARASMKKIRRAVLSARLEGYSIAIFGALSLAFSFGNIGDMLLAGVLTAIGIVEIIGAGKLARLDLGASRLLAFNQLTLAVLILLYALWNIHGQLANPDAALEGLSPSDIQAIDQSSGVLSMTNEIMMVVYVGMIVAALAEAAMALYYHTRAAHIRQFIAQTPEWIVAMQKTGVSI